MPGAAAARITGSEWIPRAVRVSAAVARCVTARNSARSLNAHDQTNRAAAPSGKRRGMLIAKCAPRWPSTATRGPLFRSSRARAACSGVITPSASQRSTPVSAQCSASPNPLSLHALILRIRALTCAGTSRNEMTLRSAREKTRGSLFCQRSSYQT